MYNFLKFGPRPLFLIKKKLIHYFFYFHLQIYILFFLSKVLVDFVPLQTKRNSCFSVMIVNYQINKLYLYQKKINKLY